MVVKFAWKYLRRRTKAGVSRTSSSYSEDCIYVSRLEFLIGDSTCRTCAVLMFLDFCKVKILLLTFRRTTFSRLFEKGGFCGQVPRRGHR